MSSFIERPRYYCSLGGAMGTASSLPATIPILHAAGGCAGNIVWTQNGGSALQVGGYCGGLNVPSSNVQEREVVFGGAARLQEQIENTLEVMNGQLFVVLTSCVTEVIGDDVRAVVAEFRERGVPIVAAETGGFKGNSYYGYDLVLKALFADYLESGPEKVKGKVNLLGIVPFMDVFWRGNLEGLRCLLEGLGLEVNTFFTAQDNLEAIKQAASAELNIVVSDVYGVEAAQAFQDIHGTPYILTPLPIGPAASDAFLRQVGTALSLNQDIIETFIDHENQLYYTYLEPLIECYNDLDLQRYAAVIGDANYSVAITRFLSDDLGWLPELVVFTDQLNESQEKSLGERTIHLESGLTPKVVFETDTSEIIRHLEFLGNPSGKYNNPLSPAFVVGSSLDRELAQKIGAPHLSVSFPVANRAIIDRSYTGYRGGLRLMEDLLSAIIAGR
ncbi:MAG TPA: nitrogenase component 1 [Syntrophomonadaceae bacterium]|nr:nitrogenase component 1 [Syntrophomonadaceae bacterium]